MSIDQNCEKLQPDGTGVRQCINLGGLNDGNFRIEEGMSIIWFDGVRHRKSTETHQSIDRSP